MTDKQITKLINRINFGPMRKCGFRESHHGGYDAARIRDRAREVYARMAEIEDGMRR